MAQNIHVINAEPSFLPHLKKLHTQFPRLRMVLEHATTRAAVEAVESLGSTVACTITAHHLALTVDDWAGQSWNYCKPVAKFPDDRNALREIIREGGVISSVQDERSLTPDQAIHVFS
jgi:dihydroorotase